MAAQHQQHHIPPVTSSQMAHAGPVLPLQMHYPQGQQQVLVRSPWFDKETTESIFVLVMYICCLCVVHIPLTYPGSG